MAKHKSTSGRHATPRSPVQIPADWMAVIRQLAAARPAPAVWLIIELVEREAKAAGIAGLPSTPWSDPPPAPKRARR
jgi:hypothetical protein